jgi:L-threonylcarbamoyladenylate synthase
MRAAAAAQVRAAKGRDDRKPLPLVAASLAQVCALCADWPEAAQALSQLWPGPLTLVLPARADVPHQVTAGTATLAVRIPALALTRALCLAAGPLISTSANLAGEPAPLRCSEAVAAVGAAAVMAIDAGPGTPVASSIVDLSGSRPRLLRAGAVTQAAIERALGVPLDRPGPQAL